MYSDWRYEMSGCIFVWVLFHLSFLGVGVGICDSVAAFSGVVGGWQAVVLGFGVLVPCLLICRFALIVLYFPLHRA